MVKKARKKMRLYTVEMTYEERKDSKGVLTRAKLSSQIGLFCLLPFSNKSRRIMFKKLRELYREYRDWVRVDLVMYAVMIVMIILYVIFSLVF